MAFNAFQDTSNSLAAQQGLRKCSEAFFWTVLSWISGQAMCIVRKSGQTEMCHGLCRHVVCHFAASGRHTTKAGKLCGSGLWLFMLPAASCVHHWATFHRGIDIKLAQHETGAAIAHQTARPSHLLRSGYSHSTATTTLMDVMLGAAHLHAAGCRLHFHKEAFSCSAIQLLAQPSQVCWACEWSLVIPAGLAAGC